MHNPFLSYAKTFKRSFVATVSQFCLKLSPTSSYKRVNQGSINKWSWRFILGLFLLWSFLFYLEPANAQGNLPSNEREPHNSGGKTNVGIDHKAGLIKPGDEVDPWSKRRRQDPGKTRVIQTPCEFPSFTTGSSFAANGDDPIYVASGDLNNDTKPDAVVVNSYGNNMTYFLGTGAGGLMTAGTLPTGTYPTYVAFHDLDNDGNQDVIVANKGGNSISIFKGDGAGHLSPFGTLDTVLQPLEFRIADANNDGKLDIIYVATDESASVGKIGVLLGNGDATFGPTIDTSVPTPYTFPALGVNDFNNDGKVDVIDRTSSNVRLWSGNGDGTFSMTWTSNAGFGPVAVDDLNGDGKLDFVTSDFFSRIVIFIGNGDGTFQVSNRYTAGGSPFQIVIKDVNRDGVKDIVTTNFLSNQVSILRGDGNGQFAPVVNQIVGNYPGSVAIDDFDGDGIPDLLTESAIDKSIYLTFGKGDGTFRAPINWSLLQDSFPNSVAIADLNSDGKDDVITANSEVWGISVLLRTGPFKFAERRDFLSRIYIKDLVTGDFNHDGRLDVIGVGGAGDGSGSAYVMLGDGSGGLTLANSFQLQTGYDDSRPLSIVARDFDLDGNLDIVVGTRTGDGHLFYFKGVGDGTFGAAIEYPTTLDPILDIATADLNGDSYSDLVVLYDTGIDSLESRIEIWMNNGSGQFVLGATYFIGFSEHPDAIAVGDFNGDGRQDFAVSVDYNAGTPAYIQTFQGNSNGTFTPDVRFDVKGLQPRDIISSDFNLDGKVDLATTNDSTKDVSVFRGTGLGSFTLDQKMPAGNQSNKMAVGNLNADNSPDLVVTNYNGSSFTIMPNGCDQAVDPGPVTVSGHIFTSDGRAVRNAIVSITDNQDGTIQNVPTGSFGNYQFADIQSGDPYTINVASKHYRFLPQTLLISGNLTNVDFTGDE